MLKNYMVKFIPSARNDLVSMKKYILRKFKYSQYGLSFDNKIRRATASIKNAPTSFKATEFTYRGFEIYMRCINTFLFFYIVDDDTISILRVLKDGMNWEYIMKLWLKRNE